MDRRIQKTRQAIMSAFIDLINETSFDKLTINYIAERANVNRGTVYLHYVDKYDLLDKCIETYTDQLIQYCEVESAKNPNVNSLLYTFDYLKDNFLLYRTLMTKAGIGFFRNRLYTLIATKVMETQTDDNTSRNDISTHFLTSAIVGVIEWWLVNSMPCSTEEVTTQLWDLLQKHEFNI